MSTAFPILLIGVTLLAVVGWWKAVVDWHRALEREELLLELVAKLIAELPTLSDELRDLLEVVARDTRH